MRINCDRKYLSARILHYAANKIWILTTMASFISKGAGDNPISCFPAALAVQSQARRAGSLSILGGGGTPRGSRANNRAAPGMRAQGTALARDREKAGEHPALKTANQTNPPTNPMKISSQINKISLFLERQTLGLCS